MCDTDSLTIVSSAHGGLVPCPGGSLTTPSGHDATRALPHADVDAIRAHLDALNPYDKPLIPDLFKLESVNLTANGRRELHCFSISAKRYVLYEPGRSGEPSIVRLHDGNEDENEEGIGPLLVESKQHGLGYLLNPSDPDDRSRDWISEAWQYLLRLELGLPAREPDWLDLPALSQVAVSTPDMLATFKHLNVGRPYAEQIKPFNFVLAAHVAPFGHPPGADPERFQLLAPYHRDPRQWRKLRWLNKHDPRAGGYTITTTGQGGAGRVRVKSYRDVLDAYRVHPEAKSLAPDGQPCGPATKGLLGRRRVHLIDVQHIGKEANKLHERQAGLVHAERDVLSTYTEPAADPWPTLVAPVLRELPVAHAAKQSGAQRLSLSFAAFPELFDERDRGRMHHVLYWLVHRLDPLIALESLYRYLRKFHSTGERRYVLASLRQLVPLIYVLLSLEFMPRRRRL